MWRRYVCVVILERDLVWFDVWFCFLGQIYLVVVCHDFHAWLVMFGFFLGVLFVVSGLVFGYSYFGSGMWGDWVVLMKGIDMVWLLHDFFNILSLLFVIVVACWGFFGIKIMCEGELISLLILASSSIVVWLR